MEGGSRVLHYIGRAPGFRIHVLSHVPDVASGFSRYFAAFHLRRTDSTWEDGLLQAVENVARSDKIDVLLPVALDATHLSRSMRHAKRVSPHCILLMTRTQLRPVETSGALHSLQQSVRFP